MSVTTVPYEVVKEELLRDPEVRAAYEALEPAYQVTRLRILRGLTQEQLAERVGTKQPSIARLESGKTAPRLDFLRRVVEALGGKLTILIELEEEAERVSVR
jgi:transcriptional regulator with XRE-family HTH domain